MKTYDLYLLAPDAHLISGWHKFEAAGDKEALEIAEALVRLPPAELWQGSELVKQWSEAPSVATPARSAAGAARRERGGPDGG